MEEKKVFLKEYSNIHLNGETNRLRKMEEKNIPPKYSQENILTFTGTSEQVDCAGGKRTIIPIIFPPNSNIHS